MGGEGGAGVMGATHTHGARNGRARHTALPRAQARCEYDRTFVSRVYVWSCVSRGWCDALFAVGDTQRLLTQCPSVIVVSVVSSIFAAHVAAVPAPESDLVEQAGEVGNHSSGHSSSPPRRASGYCGVGCASWRSYRSTWRRCRRRRSRSRCGRCGLGRIHFAATVASWSGQTLA